MKTSLNRIRIIALLLLCFLSAACGDRAERTYRQGLRLARQKKYDQAVGEMRRLLQLEPESIRARNALGQIYRAQNLYNRAIEELTLAVEMSGDDPVPAYNLGGVYWDLEDMERAVGLYRQALEIDPEFAPALYRLGVLSSRGDDPATAAEYFRAFLRTAPEDPSPGHNNLGVLLWKSGDREEAFREFEQARRAGAGHPEVLYNYGVSSLLLDQQNRRGTEALLDYFRFRPDARERMDLKRLLERSSSVSVTEAGLFTRDDYLRQGQAYEAAGQYRLAGKEYRQALELDPAAADAHYRLGRISDRFLGDPAAAVSHYESFLKLRPRSPEAGEVITRLGEIRPEQPDIPTAAAPAARKTTPRPPLTSASDAAATPPSPEEYCRQGERLAREGEPDRAAAVYRQCLEQSPDYPPAFLGLGKALLDAGDYSEAETALNQARQLDPAAPAGQYLGRVYILRGAGALASGRFEESMEYYRKARQEGLVEEAEEGLWKARHNYYRRLREEGDHQAAALQLEKCLLLRPEVEEDYLELAELYGEELGRSDRARHYYQKYLEAFPRGKFADRAGEKLRPSPPAPSVPPDPAAPPPARELSGIEHYNRGAVYQREGKYPAAREEYLKAVRSRPDLYQAFYNLGIIYHREGRTDRALAAFKEAARLNPDFPQVQLSLFNLYYHHYRMKNLARPHAQRYIELAPDTPQARELRRGLGL